MANEDFLSISVKDVTFQWPRLDQPYRYDKMQNASVPCSADANNAQYSISWEVGKDEGKALFSALRDHYNKCRARNSKLPEFSTVFGMKRDDTNGTVRFTAKRNAKTKDGKISEPPKVVQAMPGFPALENKKIWGGSFGALSISAYPTIDPDDRGGISINLNAVIVKKAVYGGNRLEDEFGDYGSEGGFEIEGATPEPQPAKAAATPTAPAPVPADAEW